MNTSDTGFEGATFPHLAANTVDRRGRAVLPASAIVERAGARIGFIGVTTASTPDFLLPAHGSSFRFRDVSASVNREVRALRARGVEAIVVLAHAGGVDRAGRMTGEIFEETRAMSDAVDVVVAGHTHTVIDAHVPHRSVSGSKLVVQAGEYGRAFDRIELGVDRGTGQVVDKRARVIATAHRGVWPKARLTHLVDHYRSRVRGVADRVLGRLRAPMHHGRRRGERGLGRFVAEAQRELADADVALVDPVSVRAGVDAGPVTFAELFEVVPYEHPVMRARVRGEDLTGLLADRSVRRLYRSGLEGGLDPDRDYTLAASELLMTGRRAPLLRERSREREVVGTELEALVGAFARAR